MANFAWPHTPASDWARLELRGGPFDGETVGFLAPDLTAPAQVAWAGWFPWGFTSYVYEWRNEVRQERGRTAALIYRSTGRRGTDVPPVVVDEIELWLKGTDMINELGAGRLFG